MTTKELETIKVIFAEVQKATKQVEKSKFQMETLLSLYEIKSGKGKKYNNSKDLFTKLGIS
jgi:hypothetical protein